MNLNTGFEIIFQNLNGANGGCQSGVHKFYHILTLTVFHRICNSLYMFQNVYHFIGHFAYKLLSEYMSLIISLDRKL